VLHASEDEKCMQNFSLNPPREETAWEVVGVDGRMVLK
jgi:hypothetical protein